MTIHRLLPNAKQVIRARDFDMLPTVLKGSTPNDLAEIVTDLPPSDQLGVLRHLPRSVAVDTFQYLTRKAQERLLKTMPPEEAADILNQMSPDDRTTLLEGSSATISKKMLELLAPEERAVAVSLLEYPEGSVGRLMTPDYIALRENWSVQQVLDYIREHGQDSETLNVVYVVDDKGVLLDDIRMREFLLTPLTHRVSDLMDRRFVALQTTDDQQAAVAVFKREDRTVLPVVDAQGILVGIVTIDDILDVAEQAATKDFQKVGGLEALDEPYMQIGLGRMVRKRAGWLVLLFLGEMLTATAMGFFEKEIARAVVLALFIPLIISSGGNSGSQASTLVIRALAIGEVRLRDWWRVFRREILSGLALGAILGTIGFSRVAIWSAFSSIYGPHWLLVALTVGCALIGIVLWGTLAGSTLPFILRGLGFDPATSSAPFVATLVDVTGLVIYFTIASLILRGTLL
jgi:magnesium transporter